MSLFNILNEFFANENKDKKINDKLFNDEADALGLDKWERENAKKSEITPEEWLEDNEPDYYDELDK